jgi:signal transduction histidine kinase
MGTADLGVTSQGDGWTSAAPASRSFAVYLEQSNMAAAKPIRGSLWGHLPLRVVAPTLFVSLLLVSLCTLAAVYLYRQQSNTALAVGENVESRRIAEDLRVTLIDLAAFVRGGGKRVGDLDARVREGLARAEKYADKPMERELVEKLRSSFLDYQSHWDAGTAEGRKLAVATLTQETMKRCEELREYNQGQIEESQREQEKTVRWLALGFAVIGGVGSAAGLVFGFGVARALHRSLHQLSIHIQDAAGKLRQDLPMVTLSENGAVDKLSVQLRGVVGQIETVVARLQQREREVLRAEQLAAVGQLAAGVAHELRNPLTSIKLLLQASREEAQQRGVDVEDLGVIEQEIRRMERSLQTFLDFARPPKPERRPTDLNAVVEATLGLVGGRARKQHVEVRFSPVAPAPIAEVDAGQVQQLLINLTLNSLDAMPHSGVLEARLKVRDDYVEAQVLDTGPGIAPEILVRLFEPFLSGKETGLGLGLVISRRIAESHGGSLTAANRPEGGACFTLRLPLRSR